jgi:predicted nucleic acid-binding protein
VILDTNAVSFLLEGDRNLGRLLENVACQYLPLPVIGQFQFGLLALRRGRRRYESLFRRLEAESAVLYPDRETADWYASIRHELKRRGQPIPESDIWIAALARQHSLEIISRDVHFDHIDGVRRIDW